MSWLMRWRQRRECWHHVPHPALVPGDPQTAQSFIVGTLIDLGRRKMFTCTRCGRKWFS